LYIVVSTARMERRYIHVNHSPYRISISALSVSLILILRAFTPCSWEPVLFGTARVNCLRPWTSFSTPGESRASCWLAILYMSLQPHQNPSMTLVRRPRDRALWSGGVDRPLALPPCHWRSPSLAHPPQFHRALSTSPEEVTLWRTVHSSQLFQHYAVPQTARCLHRCSDCARCDSESNSSPLYCWPVDKSDMLRLMSPLYCLRY